MAVSDVTIFHNPKCGTSRKTLALLEEAGLKPNVVEYLKAGWTRDQLQGLLSKMGVSAQAVLRTRGTNAEELGLTADGASDEKIIDAMVADPILVERPIVETPAGAALCRPVDKVLPLLSKEARAELNKKGLPAP